MRRFGTATLLRWTAVCAVYLGLSTMIGYAPTAVLCVSVAVLTWAIVSKLSGWWLRGVRVAVGVVASVAIWFSAVAAIWSMERCDRCRSERYTIDYQVIGLQVASSELTVPTWCELTADALGVACKHRYRSLPYDDYRASIQPILGRMPHDRGALMSIIVGVYSPEDPWWHFYDFGRKWYFEFDLLTDDFSPELASRLRQLSIDQPDVPKRFWDRVENDRDYPWDGLLVDLLALTAADNGELHDAIAWLEGSSLEEKRFLDGSSVDERLIENIEKFCTFEIGDVLVYRVRTFTYRDNENWAGGHSVIRLPDDPNRRSQALQKLEDIYETGRGETISITDYGQRFFDAQLFLNAM